MTSGTLPPPSFSAVPSGEEHAFAVAADGTRLFVRSRERILLEADGPGIAGRDGRDGVPELRGLRAILCDGILCDGFIWKYLWDDLADLVPLTHWHYRGHGRSATPRDPDRIDIAAHADDLKAVCAHVGDPPTVLIGHSMGCQVVLEGYRRHPDKVRALVLVCGSFGKVTSTVRGVPVLEMILPKLLEVASRRPDLVRAIWSRIPSEMALKVALRAGEIDSERIRHEDVMPYLKHMTHVDFPLFLRMLQAAGDHSAGDWLSTIQVPTLIIGGERDTLTPGFLSEAMAEAIPGSELLMVKNGTHVAPLEQAALVDERITDFVKRRVLSAVT